MKIKDSIHLLQIDFEISISPEKKIPRFVNVILIFGDKITLIDTGVKGSENRIFDYLQKNGRDFSEIETVILSHSHPDHIGSASRIKELTGCMVFAHELEKDWIEDIELQNKLRPVPGFFNLVDTPVKVDGFISHNQVIEISEGILLKFIHSPGHSKGSLNIEFVEDKILFTADSIPLKNDIPNYDNYLALMDSLKLIKANNNFEILLTSWTPPLVDKNEIARLLGEGEQYMRKIDSIVKESYKDKYTDTLEFCKCTVGKLGLPPFIVNPIVDKAFKSHLD